MTDTYRDHRRASFRLGLQATAEGLSIAAIGFYAIGLLLYFANGIAAAGAPINVTIVMGLATPLIGLIVWHVVRRSRNRIMTQAGSRVEGEAAP